MKLGKKGPQREKKSSDRRREVKGNGKNGRKTGEKAKNKIKTSRKKNKRREEGTVNDGGHIRMVGWKNHRHREDMERGE